MIVLLSGGQDSTTCLYWALARGGPVDALAVDYGQRHRCELEAAQMIADEAGVTLHMARFNLAVRSALTSDAPIATRPDGLPTTFVPGRNGLFLWAAAGLAKQLDRDTVVIGCSAVDYSDSLAWSYGARRSAPLAGCPHASCANCPIYALAWRRRVLDEVFEATRQGALSFG